MKNTFIIVLSMVFMIGCGNKKKQKQVSKHKE